MILNRRRIIRNKDDKLPYDAEIEYLESTGTQYIDTNVNLYQKDNFTLNLSFVPTRFWNYNMFLTFANSSNYETYYGAANAQGKASMVWKYPWKSITVTGREVNVKNDIKYQFYSDENNSHVSIQVDGNVYATYDITKTSVAANGIVSLFRRGSYYAEIKLYNFSIEANEIKILDLIPVRIGQVGYMYDKVNGTLFGNSGTGNFILGNDKNS